MSNIFLFATCVKNNCKHELSPPPRSGDIALDVQIALNSGAGFYFSDGVATPAAAPATCREPR